MDKCSAKYHINYMALDKKPSRTTRPKPASFRLSAESVNNLKTIATILNRSQADIIESLIEKEFEYCQKKYPSEFNKTKAKK